MTSGAFDQSQYPHSGETFAVQDVRTLDGALARVVSYAPYAIAFCLPIRLSWTYLILIPALLSWLYLKRHSVLNTITVHFRHPIVSPLILFLGYCMFSAAFGLAPLLSIHKLAKVFFYALLIPFIMDKEFSRQPQRIMLFLFSGHAITCFHSVLALGFPDIIPSMFVGTLTESGQLSLSLLLALGLLAVHLSEGSRIPWRHYLRGLLLFALCCGLAFLPQTQRSPFILGLLLLPTIYLWGNTVLTILRKSIYYKAPVNSFAVLLCSGVIPLLAAGILANLKRGPWLGVAITTMILLLYYLPRFLIPVGTIALGICLGVAPVFNRLAQSLEHFFISGGRSSIWNVGIDISFRFPLGIGYANSEVLQQYDPSIPAELEHFHNNVLNVLVETGWPGVFLLTWWLWRTIARGFTMKLHNKRIPILHILSLSLLSLQIAGIVEYNIGDSEVLLLVFLIVSLFLLEERSYTSSQNDDDSSSDKNLSTSS